MDKKIIISILFIFMILISFKGVLSVCSVNFDKEIYSPLETVTADMVCTESAEKSKTYNLEWLNQTGTSFQNDTGTTPSTAGQHFFETFLIPSNWNLNITVNSTLTGSNLEGTDSANVTVASSNDLLITNITFTASDEIFIGRVLGVEFTIKDDNAKKISNAQCTVAIEDGDGFPILVSEQFRTNDGFGDADFILDSNSFSEDRDYEVFIHCYCGIATTSNSCIDEDGTEVSNSIGSSADFFNINKYLNVNTVVDKTLYNTREKIFICANVSNPVDAKRIPLQIFHQVRCSAGSDNDADLDREIIISDLDMPDERGINANATQMQCRSFTVPEPRYLQGRNSECYASTSVWVLDDKKNPLIGYATNSSVFNISNNELNLQVDWQWVSDLRLNSIINLSDSAFNDWNGSGRGNIDIHLLIERKIDVIDSINIFNIISNITVKNNSQTLTEHTHYELEFLEDGNVEIELRDVVLDKTNANTWWNISVDFYDIKLRDTVALEDIANKTGTFRLEVDCPADVNPGDSMSCKIIAQIEDSQTVEKEVDFTCYIEDGDSRRSTINFNQMVNRTPITIRKKIDVPSDLTYNQEYTLKCEAGYYNLGSRIDTFFDTFITKGDGDVEKEVISKAFIMAGAIFFGGLLLMALWVILKRWKEKRVNTYPT